MNMRQKEHSITTRGLKTAWLQYGSPEKPILLMLHGYPDSPECYRYQIDYFKKDFQVVVPYVRGCGPSESSKKIDRFRLDALATDTLDVLKHVDPSDQRKVYLLSHDMGAPLAWHLMPLLGSRLEKSVVMNGLSLRQMLRRWKFLSQHRRFWYIYLMQFPGLLENIFRVAPVSFKRWMVRLGGRVDSLTTKNHAKTTLINPSKQYRAFMLDMLKMGKYHPSNNCPCPLLVLWGAKDPFLNLPTRDEILMDAKKLTIRMLEGSHWMHLKKHEMINKLVFDHFTV